MRLFYGLQFQDVHPATELQKALTEGVSCRTPSPENLHVTLVFLGEIPPDRVPELRALLDTLPDIPRTVAFSGLRIFPARRGLGTLCLLADREPRLLTLQAELEGALRIRGFSLEDRDYLPHMTLARKYPRDRLPPPLQTPLVLTTAGASLLLSQTLDGKHVYTPLRTRHP